MDRQRLEELLGKNPSDKHLQLLNSWVNSEYFPLIVAEKFGQHLLQHLAPYLVFEEGVAQYDIEVGALIEVDFRDFVETVYRNLEDSQKTHSRVYKQICSESDGKGVLRYRQILVKDLTYVEKLGLTEGIDWGRVERVVPDSRAILLDLPKDSGNDVFPYFKELMGE